MPATWGIFKHLQAKFFLEIAQFSSRKTCENYLGIFLQVLCRFLWLPRTSVCSGHMGTYVAYAVSPFLSPYMPTKHLLEIYRLQILIKDAGDECRRFILVSPSLSLSALFSAAFTLLLSLSLRLLHCCYWFNKKALAGCRPQWLASEEMVKLIEINID